MEVEAKVIRSIRKLQAIAREAVHDWKTQAQPGQAFARRRVQAHNWLRLMMRAWKEEAGSTAAARKGGEAMRTEGERRRAATVAIGAASSVGERAVCEAAYEKEIQANASKGTGTMEKKKANKQLERWQRRIKVLLTYMRLISAPRSRGRKRWRIMRTYVKAEKERRAREEEGARRAAELERIREQRGNLPCAATRRNDKQPTKRLVTKDSRGQKQKWNGGFTHTRSRLGERMMEQLTRLVEEARRAAAEGIRRRNDGDG